MQKSDTSGPAQLDAGISANLRNVPLQMVQQGEKHMLKSQCMRNDHYHL